MGMRQDRDTKGEQDFVAFHDEFLDGSIRSYSSGDPLFSGLYRNVYLFPKVISLSRGNICQRFLSRLLVENVYL